MTCDEVRERLPEHVLGTLDDVGDLAIRRHLRGCAGCRHEMDALGEGLVMFAHAAHDTEPPAELHERVMGTLADEWRDVAPVPSTPARGGARWAWLTAAAVLVALVLSLTWGIGQHNHITSIVRSDRYTQLLGILGGKEFRAGTLTPGPGMNVQGSAVIYDSHEGQSWAAVFMRGPDLHGPAIATLHDDDGRAVDLYDVHFQSDGSGSAWLVTAMDLQDFDRVTITGAGGRVIATAPIKGV
jgi:hypothetical protein